VNYRAFIVLALCLSLFALGGRVSADIIIDENFDANPLIDSQGPRVTVMGMMMGQWLHDMSAGMVPPFAAWRYDDQGYVVGASMGMGMGMGMMMEPWYRTLVYFVAIPPAGRDADGVELSFDSKYISADPYDGVATFGVFGWDEDDIVSLDSPSPGQEGTELIAGTLPPYLNNHNVIELIAGALQPPPGPEWYRAGGIYFGDLDQFGYIGVTFTFGDTTGSEQPVALSIDNVRLDVIPEPSSMALGALGIGTAAYIRRRRKRKHRNAAAPPG